jgi:hypothetical protein
MNIIFNELVSSAQADYESKTLSLLVPKLAIPNQSLVQSLVYTSNPEETS